MRCTLAKIALNRCMRALPRRVGGTPASALSITAWSLLARLDTKPEEFPAQDPAIHLQETPSLRYVALRSFEGLMVERPQHTVGYRFAFPWLIEHPRGVHTRLGAGGHG